MNLPDVRFLVGILPATFVIALSAAPQRAGGVIVGTVLLQDGDSRPLRQATVRLSGSVLETSRVTITADDGSFRFDRVPAGRFTLTASRQGYVTGAYGSTHGWTAPGMPVAVVSGQQVDGIVIR